MAEPKLSQISTVKKPVRISIKAEIEPGKAKPTQQATWLKLWARLLSKCQNEAEGQIDSKDSEGRNDPK